MKVEFSTSFIKIFHKRFSHQSHTQEKFFERTRIFAENPDNPILKDHALIGSKKGYRSFSITGDIRVVYQITRNIAYFIDIGTHNQVY